MGRVVSILASAACYYLATRIAWVLCFPDSKVSLFFPPHAILVSFLLLVPVRYWWAYVLAAVSSHFVATQQEHWPPLYALQCEAFDAANVVLTAAGIRLFIRSRRHRLRRVGGGHHSVRIGVLGRGVHCGVWLRD
jgi:integral membrane sensor domain MASE1